MGLDALLVFLYLSMKVAGAQPSFSSIWMYHQPLRFFSMTCQGERRPQTAALH